MRLSRRPLEQVAIGLNHSAGDGLAAGEAIAKAVKTELREWTVIYHDEELCEAHVKELTALEHLKFPLTSYEYEILLDSVDDPGSLSG